MGIKDDRLLVKKLCDIESGLTHWEVEFVEGIARQVYDDKRALTIAQREVAEEIEEAHL